MVILGELSLNGINISTAEFLSAFCEPAENVCFRIIADRNSPENKAFSGSKYEKEQGRFHEIEKELHANNERGRGIFFAVNHGGHDDVSITRINAQFVEMDDVSLEEQLERIKRFPLPPSLIVKTRKSLHCYWLMDEKAQISEFRHIQRQLVKQFNGDPACINESRVFRLPNFYHHKEEPILVECIKFNPELRYSQRELSEQLPDVPVEVNPDAPQKTAECGTQKGLVITGKRCCFLQHCKRNAKTLPEPLWYAKITNLAVFEGGEDAIHKFSKPHPKYDYEQTQRKIDHFNKSGTKPMTCAKIAERGFECPNFKKKSCKCKSPAGLAYFPMSVPELTKALNSVKIKKNAAEDMQLAQQFINDYLFNVDPRVADVFITNDIKTHFGFKAAEVRGLPSYHKELYNGFAATREAREIKSGIEIPPWYEVNGKGKKKFLPGKLADILSETENVIYCGESYYFYEKGVYVPRNEKTAQRKVRSMMDTTYALASEIKDAEWQWMIEIDKTVREINVNPYILNFDNGLYYVHEDIIKPHDPKILSTIRLGGGYKLEAKCPVFMQYLDDVLPKSEHALIQEVMGYFLIAINKAQKSFVIVGKPDSGKSTFLYVIQDILLGQDNVSNLSWQHLDEKFATVQLFGKLANIFGDLPSTALKDTGTFKAITGEDYISVQHKFKEYFSFKPFARLLFSCNEIPKNYSDRTDGFYRRLLLIRFDAIISALKKDEMLPEKLKAESDGIIAFAMEGLKRLMANNYRFSETDRTRMELTNYKTENSSVLAFVEECCDVSAEYECFRTELYSSYLEYCNDRNYNKPMSDRKFNSEIDGVATIKRGQ